MPQLELSKAQALVLQVVENPDDPRTQAIGDRALIEALATILVRNGLLAVAQSDG